MKQLFSRSEAHAGDDVESAQLMQIRHQFVDIIWRGMFFLALIAMPVSLSRFKIAGWRNGYLTYIVVALLLLLVFFFSKKLSLRFKSITLIGMLWLVGVSGLLTFGLAAPSIWWLILSCLVASVVYSVRAGLLLVGAVLLLLVAVACAFVGGYWGLPLDANLYFVQPQAWATVIVANGGFVLIVIFAMSAYHRAIAAAVEFRTRQWIEELPLGLFVVGADGKPHYANARSGEILGKGVLPDAAAQDIAQVYNLYREDSAEIYPAQ
ncbi:MAG: hypothetical protein RL748_4149, partial [Pseudomonadota bacterium]